MHSPTLAEVPLDAVRDTLPLVPVLFVLYAVLEYVSHKKGFQLLARSRAGGAFGPVAGAILGVIPQCGMSVFMTSLYVSGRVTTGTLVSTYLATSDEALPVLLAHGRQGKAILTIIGIKLVAGTVAGLIVDHVLPARSSAARADRPPSRLELHTEGELEHTRLTRVLAHSLRRTLEIFGWVLLVSMLLGALLAWVQPERLVGILRHSPVLEIVGTALFGLIPNCAASIAIAEGLIHGVLSFGAAVAGLSAGAGYGPIVLLKERQFGRAATILTVCLVVAVATGFVVRAAELRP